MKTRGRNGVEFTGTLNIEHLWKPYFPLNEYTVIYGESGTGKTFFTSLACAYVSRGWEYPFDYQFQKQSPGNVLYITGEESFEEVTDRLIKAGGDPAHLTVIDRADSLGLNFKEGFEEFSEIVQTYKPRIMVCDPWQCFVGETVDLNRQNHLRTVCQRIALLAGKGNCSIILIAHTNKGEHGQNANNAASGSKELINAARSAIKIIEDEEDEDRRIAVHTKANHAKLGKSVCYRFLEDGSIRFDGTSDITKRTLEQAARARKTPGEMNRQQQSREAVEDRLILVLTKEAENTEKCGKRLTYEDIKLKYGEDIFGNGQAKRVLDGVSEELKSQGITLETGKVIRRGSQSFNGFFLQKYPIIQTENI